jgi:hypothetical protein
MSEPSGTGRAFLFHVSAGAFVVTPTFWDVNAGVREPASSNVVGGARR